MKKSYLFTIFLIILAIMFASCEQATNPAAPDAVDKAALTDAIGAASTLKDSVTVGTAVGNMPQSAVDIYTLAITAAQTVADSANTTQTEVDTAIITLATATGTFNTAIIGRFTSTAGTVNFSSTIEAWDSGTTIETYTEDSTYNSVIKLTSGTSWGGAASCAAFREYPANELLQYTTLEFKIKTSDYTTIKVKMPDASTVEKEYTISDGTALSGNWVQMSIALSDFEPLALGQNQFGILNSGTGIILIADVEFSGAASGETYLVSAISKAETLKDSKTVGTNDGNVPQSAKDALSTAIETAQTVIDSGNPAWTSIQPALADLTAAIAVFNRAIVVAIPTSIPAVPSLPAGDVISMYNSSATYTDSTGINWNPGWGQGGSLTETVVATKTLKLLDLVDYQGVDFDLNRIDITGKTTLHLSYWTANGTVLSIYAINAAGEEQQLTPTLTQGTWSDLDITFTIADLTSIRQLKFTGQTTVSDVNETGACKIWFDNIYFH